jgi:hypothetical protein
MRGLRARRSQVRADLADVLYQGWLMSDEGVLLAPISSDSNRQDAHGRGEG